jgi:hypothetical protein
LKAIGSLFMRLPELNAMLAANSWDVARVLKFSDAAIAAIIAACAPDHLDEESACALAADAAKREGRAQIAAAGFSSKWQNAFRADVFPKGGSVFSMGCARAAAQLSELYIAHLEPE